MKGEFIELNHMRTRSDDATPLVLFLSDYWLIQLGHCSNIIHEKWCKYLTFCAILSGVCWYTTVYLQTAKSLKKYKQENTPVGQRIGCSARDSLTPPLNF